MSNDSMNNIMVSEVERTLNTYFPTGKRFKSSDLAKHVSCYNATNVSYALSLLEYNKIVKIVGYEPSGKIPAGRLRIYEKTADPSTIIGETKVKQDEVDTLIKSRLDWQRLDTIFNPMSKRMADLIEAHGSTGVYIATRTENKSDDLISPNFGYIGKSKSIFGRVWCMKTNKHNACNYIKRNNITNDDIWVRFLFTEPGNESRLEQILHDRMKEKYGYTFSWREASAGNDGSILRIYEMIDKLNSREDAENIYAYVRERCVELYLENLGNELDKD
jgi:hypothetical protein